MKNLISFIICFAVVSAFGQSKKLWLYEAEQYFVKGDYHNALINYQLVINDSIDISELVKPYEVQITNQKLSKKPLELDGNKSVSTLSYVNHQIALCYWYTADYFHAEDAFLSSRTSTDFPEDQFYYAKTLMNNKKHELALTEFESFIKQPDHSDSLVRSAQLAMTGCFYAMDSSRKKSAIEVTLADSSFNSGSASFALSYFGSNERVMFSSARENGVILNPEQQSHYLCDIYWRERDKSGTWKTPVNFGRPLNSAQHDAASSVNNSDVIYYTRWSDEGARFPAIFLARMMNFKFFEAFKLDTRVNVEGFKSMHPFISLDGRTMFFSSDRPGGKGGMDIWKIELDSLGNVTGDAINLDYPINSEANEVTPFFHAASSTLFYSSDGFNSIGGQDAFKSLYDLDLDAYGNPINMGEPINSTYDDTYLVYDTPFKTGFISSDREPCDNGHCFKIYDVSNEPIKIILEGVSYNSKTGNPLANCKLTIKDVDGVKDPIIMKTDDVGYYKTEVNRGVEWFIKAQKEKFFADAAVINTKLITSSTTITQDFYLNPIPEKDIQIEGIEYDYDSDKLRPNSLLVLDKLYEFLQLNENLVVEINSHTDARGSDTYNQKLSERRAKSCVVYLVSKGLDKERLKAKGYGESEPNTLLGENKEPVIGVDGNKITLTEAYINTFEDKEKQDELHQLNRRTSFRVLGENFELKSK